MFDRRAVILKYPGRQEINKMISKNKSKTKLYMHRPLGDALFFCFLKYVFTGFLASSLIAVTLFQWQLDMTAKVAPYWSGSSVYTKGRKSKIVVSEQAVFLLPSPTPSPPVFSSSQSFLLNSFNMAPEIELASCKFPPSHKTHSYAVYQPSVQKSTMKLVWLFSRAQAYSTTLTTGSPSRLVLLVTRFASLQQQSCHVFLPGTDLKEIILARSCQACSPLTY